MNGYYLIAFDEYRILAGKGVILPTSIGIVELDDKKNEVKRSIVKLSPVDYYNNSMDSVIKHGISRWKAKHSEIISHVTKSYRFVFEGRGDMLGFCSMMKHCGDYRQYRRDSLFFGQMVSDYKKKSCSVSINEHLDLAVKTFKNFDNKAIVQSMAKTNSRVNMGVAAPKEVFIHTDSSEELVIKQTLGIAKRLGFVAENRGRNIIVHGISGSWKFSLLSRPTRVISLTYVGPFSSAYDSEVAVPGVYSPLDALIEIHKIEQENIKEKTTILQRRLDNLCIS